MPAAWEHADVFPVIARIIESASHARNDFVTHDAISTALLTDTEGAALISAARNDLDEERTPEWIAHNMVAWFSQRITVGASDWSGRFDREKHDGKWAYRMRTGNV